MAPKKRPTGGQDEVQWDKMTVMKPVKALRRDTSVSSHKLTLEDVGISGVSKEVSNMDAADVTAELETIALEAVASIMRGEGFSYWMPTRTASNHL